MKNKCTIKEVRKVTTDVRANLDVEYGKECIVAAKRLKPKLEELGCRVMKVNGWWNDDWGFERTHTFLSVHNTDIGRVLVDPIPPPTIEKPHPGDNYEF